MIPEITKTVRLHFAARKRTWYVFNHALSDFFPQYYFALFLTSSWDGRILREKSSFMCIVNALSLLQLISFMSHNWIQFCVSIFFIKCHTGKDYCGLYSNFKKAVVFNYRLLATVGCLTPNWTNRSENQVPFLYPLSCRIECLNVLMLLFYFFFQSSSVSPWCWCLSSCLPLPGTPWLYPFKARPKPWLLPVRLWWGHCKMWG